jgi:hypothetical protein
VKFANGMLLYRKSYIQYLDELNKYGIIQRGKSYSVDRFSKSIKINWNFKDSRNAILYDGRPFYQ